MRIDEPEECLDAKRTTDLLPIRSIAGIPPGLPLKSLPPRRRVRFNPSSPAMLAYRPSQKAFDERLNERLENPCLTTDGFRQYVVRDQAIGLVIDRLPVVGQIRVRLLAARDQAVGVYGMR